MNITQLQNKLRALNKLISESTGIVHDDVLTEMILFTATAQMKIQNGAASETSDIEKKCEDLILKLKTLKSKK
jgi:tRNA A-37 threonylcarbamoyl transferase component Bud32